MAADKTHWYFFGVERRVVPHASLVGPDSHGPITEGDLVSGLWGRPHGGILSERQRRAANLLQRRSDEIDK